MSSFEEVVELILIANKKVNHECSQEEIQNYIQTYTAFLTNIENFDTIVDNLESCDNYGSNANFLRKMFLIYLSNVIQYQTSEINPDVGEALRNIIFNPEIYNKSKTDLSYTNTISRARVSITWIYYPEFHPEFWNDLITNYPEDQILSFLLQFTEFSEGLTKDGKAKYTVIKDAMRSDGSDALVINYLLQRLGNGKKEPWEILKALLKWINLQYVLTEEAFPSIQSAFTQSEEICLQGIYCYRTIVKRGMPPENKHELLQQLQIPELSSQLVEEYPNSKIYTAIASLVCAGGEIAIDFNEATPYFEIGQTLLAYSEENDVSTEIAPFVASLARKREEIIPIALELVHDRIAAYFDSGNYDDRSSLIHSMTSIVKACYTCNRDIFIQYYQAKVSEMDPSELSLPTAVFLTLAETFNNRNEEDMSRFIYENFNGFLVFEPPFEEATILPYRLFVQCFNAVLGAKCSREEKTAVFESVKNNLIAYAVADDLTSEQLDHLQLFQQLLLTMFKKYGKEIDFDPELITQFVQTLSPNMLSIAASMITCLKEGRADFFEGCMSSLSELMSTSEEPEGTCELILQFVHNLEYEENAPHIESVHQFLASIFDVVPSSDELLAHYIKTCYASLSYHSLDIINECRSLPKECQSYTEMCLATKAIYTKMLDLKQPTEWISEFVEGYVEPVLSIYGQVSALSWSSGTAAETRETIRMISAFFDLIATVIEHLDQGTISEESIGNIIEFTRNQLAERYDRPEVYSVLLTFAKTTIKINPPDMIATFAAPSLSCLNTRRFDPNNAVWTHVVENLVELHYEMFCLDGDATVTVLREAFAEFVESVENLEPYFSDMAGCQNKQVLPRNRRKNGNEFYRELARYLDSIDK